MFPPQNGVSPSVIKGALSHINDLDEKNRETHSVLLGSLGAKGAFPVVVVAIVTSASFKVELELDIVVVVVKKGLAVVTTAASVVVPSASFSSVFSVSGRLPAEHFLPRSKVEETNACQTGPRTFGVLSLLSAVVWGAETFYFRDSYC